MSEQTYEALIELFTQYQKCLKEYLIAVEVNIEIFPQGILNEIRALFDHCSRIALEDLSEEEKIAEINSARRHIYRSTFDCFKELCVYYAMKLESFEKDYASIPLGEVDSGRFQPEYLRRKGDAERLAREAKALEKLGKSQYEEAASRFKEAIVCYDALDNFVIESGEELAWTVSNLKKYSKKYLLSAAAISFFVGVITSILGQWIWVSLFVSTTQ